MTESRRITTHLISAKIETQRCSPGGGGARVGTVKALQRTVVTARFGRFGGRGAARRRCFFERLATGHFECKLKKHGWYRCM